jgi:RNA-directed DNA polymerase
VDARVLERLGLTLNEKKTSIRNAGEEHFDFLGYTFGPHYSMRTGRKYIRCNPSKKPVHRIKEKVGKLLVPGNVAPWQEVGERPNQILNGWRNYFGYGARAKAYRVSSQGTRQFPEEQVFGPLGVTRLQGPMAARSTMKPVGKPDA